MEFDENKCIIEYNKFKDYNSIEEYIEDVAFCLMHFCRYDENEARRFLKAEEDMVKRMYCSKYPAYDLAMDYYPICG